MNRQGLGYRGDFFRDGVIVDDVIVERDCVDACVAYRREDFIEIIGGLYIIVERGGELIEKKLSGQYVAVSVD